MKKLLVGMVAVFIFSTATIHPALAESDQTRPKASQIAMEQTKENRNAEANIEAVADACACCCDTGTGSGSSRYYCSSKSTCTSSPVSGTCVAKNQWCK